MTLPPGLSIVYKGVDLVDVAGEVFSDGTDVLYEARLFYNEAAPTLDPAAEWDTYYSLRVGIRVPVNGDPVTVFLMPRYGSPFDPDRRPYYTRLTMPFEVGTGDVSADAPSGVEVIGHGQGIPPTVVTFDPSTQMVTGSVEGHTLAFTETTRIRPNPNITGYGEDGEFVIGYDHTVEEEGRETFYVAACWPAHFVDTDGNPLRGDQPAPGEVHGYSTGERGPYANGGDITDETLYPITHISLLGTGGDPLQRYTRDHDQWDNAWSNIGSQERADSGIGPFCGNIVSRGADYLRDMGMGWILEDLAARALGHFPGATTRHTRNPFLYNYEGDAMRGKGRVLWVLVELWRAVKLLATVRGEQRAAFALTQATGLSNRVAEIRAKLVEDFRNGSYIEYRNGGRTIAYWELGHYFQGLLVYQRAFFAEYGYLDPDVHDMMVQFADDIHENTLYWDDGEAHPRDSSITYSGFTGWCLEYLFDTVDPGTSAPTTSIGATMVAVYEWAKANGQNLGAKQDAIISQFSSVDYKWHYTGSITIPKDLTTSIDVALSLGVDFVGSGVVRDSATRIDAALSLGVLIDATVEGADPDEVPTADPIAVTSKRDGDAIEVTSP